MSRNSLWHDREESHCCPAKNYQLGSGAKTMNKRVFIALSGLAVLAGVVFSCAAQRIH